MKYLWNSLFVLPLMLFANTTVYADSTKKTSTKALTTVQQDISRATLSENKIRPSSTEMGIVIAHFGRKKKSCTKGFGICKLFPKPKNDYTLEELDSMMAKKHDNFYARFILKGNELLIEFLENIPHFDNQFYVDKAEAPFKPRYKGLLGYEYIEPVIGVYKADKTIGKFGGVRIKVKKGKKLK